MIVVACPGQGSQTPGFLSAWIDVPEYRAYLETLSEAANLDLVEHGTVSDADTIRDTAIAQPLIVAASLLSYRALSERVGLDSIAVAGHSVGEFAAAVITGVISDTQAMQLVRARGLAMADAAAAHPTGMAAVIGGEEADVLGAIAAAGLEPANRNGAGQIVAAGKRDALTAFTENPPAGARVIPLQVAGAFHTTYMAPAVEILRKKASELTPSDPDRMLFTNSDGSIVTSGVAYVDSLVSQISNPVRWDSCMDSFVARNVTGFIELLPGGALTGLAKRAMKGIPAVAVKSPEDITSAADLVTQQES